MVARYSPAFHRVNVRIQIYSIETDDADYTDFWVSRPPNVYCSVLDFPMLLRRVSI